MHRRRIVAPNGRPNRAGPDVVVPVNVPRHYEAVRRWWRFYLVPAFITLFYISIFVCMKLDAEAGQKGNLSSGGQQLRRPIRKTTTTVFRRIQHGHTNSVRSLQPVETIWTERRLSQSVDEVASRNQIETVLENYAFTMATRAYWALEDILSTDVTWAIIDHRKRSTPRMIHGRGEVRTELEALYRPYITGHHQNISKIELSHDHRGRAVTDFEIKVMESSTPEDGYKGRSVVGRYVDELIWTNASQWQIQKRTVEYTGECRCDRDIADCPPGCPDLLLGPALFDGAADRIPLESICLEYADKNALPAADPIPLSWNAASMNTSGNVRVLTWTLTRAGFFTDRFHEYQAGAYKRDSTGALVVYLSKDNAKKESSDNAGGPYTVVSAVSALFLSHVDARPHPYRQGIFFGMEFSKDQQSVYAYLNGPGVENLNHTKILTLEDVFASVGAMAGLRGCATCFQSQQQHGT